MTVLENVLVGSHIHRRPAAEDGRRALSLLDYVEPRRRRRSGGRVAAVRDSEACRGRARADVGSEAPAAGRACRRALPRGGRRARRLRPQPAARLRADGARRRAPHAVRDGHLRPRARARLRQADRERHAGRGAGGSRRHRGLPRRARTATKAARDAAARARGRPRPLRAHEGAARRVAAARRRLQPRAAGRQRRRQDDDAARHLRAGAQDGTRLVRRTLDRPQVPRGSRPARRRPRAAGPRHHRRPHRLGQPSPRRVHAPRSGGGQGRHGQRAPAVPAPRRAPVAVRGHALRRRAADARTRPRPAPAAAAADARRALARPGAADRARDLRRRSSGSTARRGSPCSSSSRTPPSRCATCREACVLEVGRVVVSGPSEELAENESVRKAYLGY